MQGALEYLVLVLAGHWLPFDLECVPSSLGSQQPHLKCEGFGLDDLGGSFLL